VGVQEGKGGAGMAMLVVCGADSATQSVLSQVNVAIGGGKR